MSPWNVLLLPCCLNPQNHTFKQCTCHAASHGLSLPPSRVKSLVEKTHHDKALPVLSESRPHLESCGCISYLSSYPHYRSIHTHSSNTAPCKLRGIEDVSLSTVDQRTAGRICLGGVRHISLYVI